MAIIVVSVLVLLVLNVLASCRPNARHSSRRQSARRLHPLRASLAFQYTAAAVVWGASFLFMKIGLEGLSFTQVVLWRLVFGALALVLVSAVSRIGLPREFRVWKHLAFLAATQCIVPWLLFSWAEQNMSSGLASIYNATTPLMTMAVSLAFLPGETLTRYKSLGVASRIRWGADRIGAVESRRWRKCECSGRLPGSDCVVRDFVCLPQAFRASSRRRHSYGRACPDQYRCFRDGSGLSGRRKHADAPHAGSCPVDDCSRRTGDRARIHLEHQCRSGVGGRLRRPPSLISVQWWASLSAQ